MRDLDVLCLGETLVDLLPDRRGSLEDCARFEPCPGGAPANVATGLARLGVRTGFRGVVGDDPFGRMLARRLAAEGIEVSLRLARERPTGMWFVALDAAGERTFFSPNARFSADKLIAPADADPAAIGRARVLHVGTSAHVLPEGRAALRAAVEAARRLGVELSFDPNVRAHLWDDLAPLRALCQDVLPRCAVAKLSEEELELCTGEREPGRAAARLAGMGVGIACVTLGARGALVRRGAEEALVAAEPVEVVDTTGAGDGFVAGLLAALSRGAAPLAARSFAEVVAAVRFANRVAGRVCTRVGAVAGLPRAGEISV
ncbi:carbohydrate kinase family protein [Anaeromyxobacter dehalogenans]|uniref:Carbohydrate kinase, PfkB n=1 Tax=Anaeromyxobacter dehalogenans (strain 2CP-C) TaxID=290397 RepID=Q2IQJ7_ANADE|nr:carbohydrate kinase [Anaeromyxobacter dehalogenans]ABC81078.1 Carbohydrate kinase, PfkB [Anaeromyxobacter dehalogenans 2CP-C]